MTFLVFPEYSNLLHNFHNSILFGVPFSFELDKFDCNTKYYLTYGKGPSMEANGSSAVNKFRVLYGT